MNKICCITLYLSFCVYVNWNFNMLSRFMLNHVCRGSLYFYIQLYMYMPMLNIWLNYFYFQSEIPVLYDDDDEYPEPRPLTDTADRRLFPNYRRYEGESDKVRINYRDAAHKKIGHSNGALVRLFRNGDKNHKGLPLTINSRHFINFKALLDYLNTKIPTPTGINHIFKWPEKREVTSIKDFRNRCVYVVSSTKTLKDVRYGESPEGFWSNKQPSAGKLRKHEVELYKGPISPKDSPVRNVPLVVTIINNLSRDKREKVILNPQTQQTFEQWLEDIANPDLPVKALYSEKAPYMEVRFLHNTIL